MIFSYVLLYFLSVNPMNTSIIFANAFWNGMRYGKQKFVNVKFIFQHFCLINDNFIFAVFFISITIWNTRITWVSLSVMYKFKKKICTNGIHKSTIRADPRSEVFKYINQKDSQRPCSCYVYIILYVGNGTKVLNKLHTY